MVINLQNIKTNMKKISLAKLFNNQSNPNIDYLNSIYKKGFPIKPQCLKTFYSNKLIRKRASYFFWKDIVDEAKWIPFKSRVGMVSKFFEVLDRSHKFGSHKQASFELESMSFCLLESENLIKG